MTAGDRSDEERATALADGPPTVTHLLPSDAPPVYMPESPD
jgi:hypothetical protein